MRERAGCGGEEKKWMREEDVRYRHLEEKNKREKGREMKKEEKRKKNLFKKLCL